MAQLVRAPPCHGGGRGFESHPGRFNRIFRMWDLSSAGRASALQAEGHRFEPCRPHSSYDLPESAYNKNMDGFPSGQRGQTVNLLQIASVVRIHHHPLDILLIREYVEYNLITRGGAVWKLVGLITRRSQVQILPPQFFVRTLSVLTDGHAQIAQLVEQRTENPRVVGSIPTLGIMGY